MKVWKLSFLSNGVNFRFHVSFRGSTTHFVVHGGIENQQLEATCYWWPLLTCHHGSGLFFVKETSSNLKCEPIIFQLKHDEFKLDKTFWMLKRLW